MKNASLLKNFLPSSTWVPFVYHVEGAQYTNTLTLTVKGYFAEADLIYAVACHGAELVDEHSSALVRSWS